MHVRSTNTPPKHLQCHCACAAAAMNISTSGSCRQEVLVQGLAMQYNNSTCIGAGRIDQFDLSPLRIMPQSTCLCQFEKLLMGNCHCNPLTQLDDCIKASTANFGLVHFLYISNRAGSWLSSSPLCTADVPGMQGVHPPSQSAAADLVAELEATSQLVHHHSLQQAELLQVTPANVATPVEQHCKCGMQ